jgi:hypothetical protein
LRLLDVDTVWTPEFSLGSAQGPLTVDLVGSMTMIESRMAAFASLIADPEAVNHLTILSRAAFFSQSWANDEGAILYAHAVSEWLRGRMRGVTLSATHEVSLTSRTSSFPVTVTNDLDVPVYVMIAVQVRPAANSVARVTIPATEVVRIMPGDRQTLTLSPTVQREGDVDAFLRLTAQDGTVISGDVVVRIHAVAYAWMGWVVVGAAFVLFAVGTLLRVRSRQAKNAETEDPDTDHHDPGKSFNPEEESS